MERVQIRPVRTRILPDKDVKETERLVQIINRRKSNTAEPSSPEELAGDVQCIE
jgi:hypothetical protein